MGQLRQALETISAQVGKLSTTQRLLIGSLCVIMVMTLFLLAQYSAKPMMVPLLPGQGSDVQVEAASYLSTTGVRYDDSSGVVMVRPEDAAAARAQLVQNGRMPGDTSLLFESIIDLQSWTNPKELNEQIYNMALQNELAGMLSAFQGIRSAAVVIDAPPASGLGMATRVPTATVTVVTDSGGAMGQGLVDAVARAVAGAKSGLEATRVNVIDAATGMARKVRADDEAISGTYLEHARKVEEQTREKLSGLLSYIPGVLVAVTAEVDVTRRRTETVRHLPERAGSVAMVSRESTSSVEQQNAGRGTRGGVQANTGADLEKNTGGGTSLNDTTTDTEFETRFGTEATNVVDPRGMPTRVAASIMVPSAYVADLIVAESGAGDAEGEGPTTADIAARFEAERSAIRDSVVPHLPRKADGTLAVDDVVVSLMPGATVVPAPASAGFGGGALAMLTGGPGGTFGAGIDTIALGALALVAVGMMLLTVKKAAAVPELPSPEELSGVPQRLEIDSDVVGEAGEGDSPMAGIELNETEVEGQQLFEQIGKLVDADPEFATRLLRRWIQPD